MNYIGLDLGTGALKGVLWKAGRVLATACRTNHFLRPAPQQVELSPEAHWQDVWGMITELAAKSAEPIGAIAAAAASGNALLLEPDGTPRTNIISWLDNRSEWRPPESWNVFEVVGWPPLSQFPLGQLHALQEKIPGALVGMNVDYLTWRLCGKRGLDYSNATPFYLMDQRTFRYHPPFLQALGIREEQLPRLVPTGAVIGTLRPELAQGMLTASTEIVAGSFDHPSAARACGVTEPGMMLLSAGTSWVGFYPSSRRMVQQGLLTDPFLAPQGGPWGSMFSAEGLGLEVDAEFTRHYGGDPERFNEALEHDDEAARSFAKGIVARFGKLLAGHHPKRLVLAGGPSESLAWTRLIESELRIPVEPSSARRYAGAAGAAGIGANHGHL